eukprot:scaffold5351_cov161-Skeletonema_marinoi.AAC.2
MSGKKLITIPTATITDFLATVALPATLAIIGIHTSGVEQLLNTTDSMLRTYFSKGMNLGAWAGRSALKEATLGVWFEEDDCFLFYI